jgi:photosystem II stability/assembly factor-like uncharacterized protein
MKKQALLILWLIICSQLTQAQYYPEWELLNPNPIQTTYTGMSIVDSNNIWMSSLDGNLLFSDDFGQSWQNRTDETIMGQYLSDICFTDSLHGWIAAGASKVYSTDDGGLNWNKRSFSGYSTLSKVEGFNNDTIVVVGSYKKIKYTLDGGITWNTSFLPSTSDHYCMPNICVNPITDDLIVVINLRFKGNGSNDESEVYISHDYGQNWNAMELGFEEIPEINSVYFCNSDTGIFATRGDYVYRTFDGGLTLEEFDYDSLMGGGFGMYYVHMFEDGRAIGYTNYYAYVSQDFGATWSRAYSFFHQNSSAYQAIEFAGDEGFHISPSGLSLYTNDRGLSYENLQEGFIYKINDYTWCENGDIWICGNDYGSYDFNGKIGKSSDGGNTWEFIDFESDDRLYGISFADEDHGITCGQFNTVLVTEDGGITWEDRSLEINNQTLYDVFTDGVDSWIISYNAILYSDDLANTWDTAFHNTNYEYKMLEVKNGVVFTQYTDEENIGQSFIMYSTDNGENWNHHVLPVDYLLDVDFLDENLMVCLGREEMYISENGGDDWQLLQTFDEYIRSVNLYSDNEWFVVSDYYIYRTRDHGISWDTFLKPNTNVSHIHYEPSGDVWLTGMSSLFVNNGANIYYSNLLMTDNKENKIDQESGIYPNPTYGLIQIKELPLRSVILKVFDYSGKLVLEKKTEGHQAVMDLSGLKSGMYILQIYDKSILITTEKVVKL